MAVERVLIDGALAELDEIFRLVDAAVEAQTGLSEHQVADIKARLSHVCDLFTDYPVVKSACSDASEAARTSVSHPNDQRLQLLQQRLIGVLRAVAVQHRS